MLSKNNSDLSLKLPKAGRYLRPSQFLNSFHNKPQAKAQNFVASKFQSPRLPNMQEVNEFKTHKKTISMPLKNLNFNISQIETQETDDQFLNNTKNTDLKQESTIIHKQLTFRNSILVVDLLNGVIKKDILDGTAKPLRRIRKNTVLLSNKLNKLPKIQ